MTVGQALQPGGGVWRRWRAMLAAEHPDPRVDPMVQVTLCPGCGLTVPLPDGPAPQNCDECGASLVIRADDLDIETAVYSRLYGR